MSKSVAETVGYIVTWQGYPMYWSEVDGRFYRVSGRRPIAVTASWPSLCARRIARSVRSWGDSTSKDYRILRVTMETVDDR